MKTLQDYIEERTPIMPSYALKNDTVIPLKRCGCCDRDLPIAEFAKNKVKKDGLQERCTPCRKNHARKTKDSRKKPTKAQKRKWLITSYGLNLEVYEKMLIEQGNKCAICNSDYWGKPSPSIDHCHNTGKVRGLLCNSCNRGLGLFQDKQEILQNAADYIKRSS